MIQRHPFAPSGFETIAIRVLESTHPFGVLETDGIIRRNILSPFGVGQPIAIQILESAHPFGVLEADYMDSRRDILSPLRGWEPIAIQILESVHPFGVTEIDLGLMK